MEKTTVITHMDADGVLSLATFLRYNRSIVKEEDTQKNHYTIRPSIYFTSPVNLLNTILISILNNRNVNNLDMLYIFDLSGTRESIISASIYKKAVWIDHHYWEIVNKPENIEFYIDHTSNSACRLVSKYFSVYDFDDLADEIDTNNIKTDYGERIRTIISYLRDENRGKSLSEKLYKFAEDLAYTGIDIIYDTYYESMIDLYKKRLMEIDEIIASSLNIYRVADLKVAVVTSDRSLPVYHIYNKLMDHKDAPFDLVLVIFYLDDVTKIEFRTQTKFNTRDLAKMFGGGGHILASGATVDGHITIDEILRDIEMRILNNNKRSL